MAANGEDGISISVSPTSVADIRRLRAQLASFNVTQAKEFRSGLTKAVGILTKSVKAKVPKRSGQARKSVKTVINLGREAGGPVVSASEAGPFNAAMTALGKLHTVAGMLAPLGGKQAFLESIGSHGGNIPPSRAERPGFIGVKAGGKDAPYFYWLDFGGRVGRRKATVRDVISGGRYMYPTADEKRSEVIAAIQAGVEKATEQLEVQLNLQHRKK